MLGKAELAVEIYAIVITYLRPHDLLQLSLTNRYHYRTTLDFLPGMGASTAPEHFLYWAIEHDDAALVAKHLTPEMLEVRFPVFPGSYAERRLRMRTTGVDEDKDLKMRVLDDHLSIWIVCLIYDAWDVLDLLLASGLESPGMDFEGDTLRCPQISGQLIPFEDQSLLQAVATAKDIRRTRAAPPILIKLFTIYGEPLAEKWAHHMLGSMDIEQTIGEDSFIHAYINGDGILCVRYDTVGQT
jgi:hypothetical protein